MNNLYWTSATVNNYKKLDHLSNYLKLFISHNFFINNQNLY